MQSDLRKFYTTTVHICHMVGTLNDVSFDCIKRQKLNQLSLLIGHYDILQQSIRNDIHMAQFTDEYRGAKSAFTGHNVTPTHYIPSSRRLSARVPRR